MKEGKKKQSSAGVPRAGGAGESSKKASGKKVKISTPPKWRSRHSLAVLKYKKTAVGGEATRPALQTLQPHPNTPGSLVGSGSPRLAAIGKQQKKISHSHKEQPKSPPVRQVLKVKPTESSTTSNDKGTQTDPPPPETSIDYRMCTEEEPPVEYWQVLAEQRRLALAETLEENEQLYSEVEQLRSEVSDLQAQLQSKDYFAMMYKIAATEDQ